MTVLRDERWPVARLIPITSSTGVEAKRGPIQRESADTPEHVEDALQRADDEAEAS